MWISLIVLPVPALPFTTTSLFPMACAYCWSLRIASLVIFSSLSLVSLPRSS